MKTFILTCLLALTAVFGAVTASGPAKADYGYTPGYGNFGYIYRYHPIYTVPIYRPRVYYRPLYYRPVYRPVRYYYRPRVYYHPVRRVRYYRHY